MSTTLRSSSLIAISSLYICDSRKRGNESVFIETKICCCASVKRCGGGSGSLSPSMIAVLYRSSMPSCCVALASMYFRAIFRAVNSRMLIAASLMSL